jgi:hypothetical protein
MTFQALSAERAKELAGKERVSILALETSCDETAAAVVENGRIIRSNVVFSQIDLHALYGGVVPEIASRAHMEACDRVVDEALQQAGKDTVWLNKTLGKRKARQETTLLLTVDGEDNVTWIAKA